MKKHLAILGVLVFSLGFFLKLDSVYIADYRTKDDNKIKVRKDYIEIEKTTGKKIRKTFELPIYDSSFLNFTGDEENELIILIGDKKINGEKYILFLNSDLEEIFPYMNASAINPIKFLSGDVNGDGVLDLSIMAFKETRYHPIYAKRPFFYTVINNEFVPLWRGSRLSSPFTEYILYDFDNDGVDELFSIEYTQNGRKLIKAYEWNGFGFTVSKISRDFFHISNLNIKNGKLYVKYMEKRKKIGEVVVDGDFINIKRK